MKKLLSTLLAVLLSLTLFGCAQKEEGNQDIVILYTNDVHCGIADEDAIGYAGLAAYKKEMAKEYQNLLLVDCGDAVQGDQIGTISKGQYIVDIMNKIGYDYATIGNHEFDYDMDALKAIIEKSNAQFLVCNMRYTGTKDSTFLDYTKAYEIKTFGDVKVAFIGVATPESIVKSTPTYFQENGEYVYDFCGASIEKLAAQVQETVDAAKNEGADYVIVLSHLGDMESSGQFTSTELAAQTNGIDAILDAHSHSTVACRALTNKDGEIVYVSSTGTKLAAIGKLVISTDGSITTTLVTGYEAKDEETETFIANIEAQYEEKVNEVVAKSEITLSCKDADGIRLVRNRETAIGDLCADAYRYNSGADIAWVNGGGIRADIAEGDVTYADIIAIHPFGNMLTMVEATGQEIIDALEMASRNTQSAVSKDGNAVGECGGFLQVSGLKYTIDTSVESTVVLNEQNEFVEISGARRVCDVLVEDENGEYVPIDITKTYTLACHDYMLKSGGDGINMFVDNTLIMDASKIDNQVLIDYIQEGLGGTIGTEYAEPQGRITVK